MSSTQPLYIEASDEITTVVERLQSHDETTVLLVAPKGAALLQSIVNLKLIKKAAKDAGKHVILVTTDKIGRNLALQIGLEHAANVDEAEQSIPEEELQEEAHVISGVRIHRYYEEADDNEEADDQNSPVEPIVPKKLMREQKEEPTKAQPTIAAASVDVKNDQPESPTEDIPSEPAAMDNDTPEGTVPVVEHIASKKNDAPEEPGITRRTIPKEGADKMPPTSPKPKSRRKTYLLIGGLVLSLLLISGGTAFLYLPKTDITAQVPATPWKEQYSVSASLAGAGSQVPAQVLTAEESQSLTFKASGTKELGELAHGTATAYNSYSSEPQKLPAGTQLTAKGRTFRTDTEVSVPGARVEAGKLVAGSVNVAISATEPGPDSNMENAQAAVTSANVIMQVVSTTGGSSRVVPVISESDITTAKNAITKSIKDALSAKLAETMKGEEYMSDSSTDVITVDVSKVTVKAGDEKDSGQVSGTATIKRMVVKIADIQAEVEKQARAKVPANTVLTVRNVKVDQQSINTADGTSTFGCEATGTTSTRVDTSDLPQKLAGKSFKEGTDIIHSLVNDKSTTISYTPAWWPRTAFPSQPRFIKVHIVYE